MNENARSPEWDRHKETVVYKDDRYTLGQQRDGAYLIADDKRFTLSCHPFEPCLYITDDSGSVAVVHNAFDPSVVLERFFGGDTVTSVTGRRYDARDFCRMAEYAAGLGNINIDDAEQVLGREKKISHCLEKRSDKTQEYGGGTTCPDGVSVIKNDPFYDVMEQYPDSVIDFCLVKREGSSEGIKSHREVLLAGANVIAEDWKLCFDFEKIGAKEISAEEFFTPEKGIGEKLNFRSAFLYPPYPTGYTDRDFDRLKGALFPSGTNGLEIYRWTTDWSDYFDDGHEWWGALCYTVYDKASDRYVVIMASATD